MKKSLLYAALMATLAILLLCGGTLLHPQDAAVAATSGGKGQFKGQCRPAGTTLNDPIVKPPTSEAHLHNFWGNLGVPSDPFVDTVNELLAQQTSCEDGSQDGGDPAYLRKNTSSYWMPQPYINGHALRP